MEDTMQNIDRVLVCGGRDYANIARACDVLSRMLEKWQFRTLIHGAARGADTVAAEWGATFDDIDVIAFPANWEVHGRRAGYLRNVEMADQGRPDVVITFPGGRGTAMMIEIAQKRGIPVISVEDDRIRLVE